MLSIFAIPQVPGEMADGIAKHTQKIPDLAHSVEVTCMFASGVWPPSDARERFLLAIKQLAVAVLAVPGMAQEAVAKQRATMAALEEKMAETMLKVRRAWDVFERLWLGGWE